jgi:hypothetical protein
MRSLDWRLTKRLRIRQLQRGILWRRRSDLLNIVVTRYYDGGLTLNVPANDKQEVGPQMINPRTAGPPKWGSFSPKTVRIILMDRIILGGIKHDTKKK